MNQKNMIVLYLPLKHVDICLYNEEQTKKHLRPLRAFCFNIKPSTVTNINNIRFLPRKHTEEENNIIGVNKLRPFLTS